MAYTREKSHAFEEQRETKRGDKACMQMDGRARKERIDIEKVYQFCSALEINEIGRAEMENSGDTRRD